MPIVYRAKSDILRLMPFVDLVVNPTDLRGHLAVGLSDVLATYFGGSVREDYLKASQDKKLKIGQLWPWESKARSKTLLNLPLKGHYADPTDADYVTRGLRSLRIYLQERPLRHVVMPLLGGALGQQMSTAEADALHREHLDDLPNIIHISQRPQAYAEGSPKYLAVVGSRRLTDRVYVTAKVRDALQRWELTPGDFAAMISGGAQGVDSIACGSTMTDASYEASLARELGLKPIIVPADWKRLGRTAGFRRNQIVADIATHCVALLDERKAPSVGTRHTIKLIQQWNKDCPEVSKHLLAFSYQGAKE